MEVAPWLTEFMLWLNFKRIGNSMPFTFVESRMRGQNTTVYLYVNTDYRLVASFMAGEYMQIVSFILS